MIKDLEQLAIKYQKIAEYALHLKRENSVIHAQLESLQQQLALLIDDKVQLEHKNTILMQQSEQIKQNLITMVDDITDKQTEISGLYSASAYTSASNSGAAGSGLGSNSMHGKLSSAAAAAAAAIDETPQEMLEVGNNHVIIQNENENEAKLQDFKLDENSINNTQNNMHALPSVDLSGGLNGSSN
jgi:hypothetical protein